MRSRQEPRARRYPLQVTIATVFSSLFLLVGLALILYNYRETRKMAMQGAGRLLTSAAAQIETRVSDLYRPILGLVNVSSQVLGTTDTGIEESSSQLRFLIESLRVIPSASMVFIGYENGDFLSARRFDPSLSIDTDRDIPEGTQYIVQMIDRNAANGVEIIQIYVDEAGNHLRRQPIEDTGFDPRQREWYRKAIATDEVIHTPFYVFFTTREIGLTVARRLPSGGAVVGADLALTDVEQALVAARITESTRVAIVGRDGKVVALVDHEGEVPEIGVEARTPVAMPRLAEIGDPVYRQLGERFEIGAGTDRELVEIGGRDWVTFTARIEKIPEREVYLAVAVPLDELLADARHLQISNALISLTLLILAVLLVVGVSRNLSRSLGALADEAERIREFHFDEPTNVFSRIREVDELSRTMQLMKTSISQFLEISTALSVEKDYRRVLEMVLTEALQATEADAGAVLMVSEDHGQLDVALLSDGSSGIAYADDHRGDDHFAATDLRERMAGSSGPSIDHVTALDGRVVKIDNLSRESGFDTTAVRRRFDRAELVGGSILSVPLSNQAEEVIGVLQLVRAPAVEGEPAGFQSERVAYVEALASDAAVALDVRRLLKAQRDLLDSLILMIAGAIDAKSPYTSGHCQRVPVVAKILADAAENDSLGKFRSFALSDDERYQLHLAAWLHDCGKVTTPEYVVDKATKLETIYNRIHEVRTRFEVLWRDAEIDYYKGRLAGQESVASLEDRLTRRQQQIRSDFDFVARCNVGAEAIADDDLERLRRIASTTWTRFLDGRQGLSHGELSRLPDRQLEPPVEEPILADRPEHIVARSTDQDPFGDPSYGFRMEVPEHQYNRGELYNLSVARGTLTQEERFKINEHVIQTIRMLENLPFPRELRQVPDWAGNHHEKLDGTGYPRRLQAAELSIPERIMAMADIFEALTATDRPYHAPKRLSQALSIMSSMCSEGHLCPDLFELFLTSGAYLEYSHQYLDPTQLDEIDIEALVTRAGS